MQNNCIVTCPCCGQFIQVEISILGARAYPFCSNPYGAINVIHGIKSNQISQSNYSQKCCISQKEDNDV